MQQSDNMLITSIKQSIAIPSHIITLSDIKIEQVIILCLNVLDYLGVDTQDIKRMTKTQRFRSMTKLNQSLAHHLQSEFELNDLMNPTLPFVRKMLLFFITKIASNEPALTSSHQISTKKEDHQTKKKKYIFQNWINDEWIHPILNNKPIKYISHRLSLPISKQSFKRNLLRELNNPNLKGSCQSIISSAVVKEKAQQKQHQAKEGLSQKQNEGVTRFIYKINQKNKEEWRKLNDDREAKNYKKLRENLFRAQEEEIKDVKNQQPTVFQRQVEEIVEEKKSRQDYKIEEQHSQTTNEEIIIQDALQKIKRQAQAKRKELQRLINETIRELKGRKQNLQQLQNRKEALEQQIIKDQQKKTIIKQKNTQIKKQLQKKQILLNVVDNQTDIVEEVKKLEQQVKNLQSQAKNQIQTTQNQIKTIQKQGKQKIQLLNDLKMKLTKIETDYKRVCEQINEKQQLKGKVKIAKSGISRLYYSKKISQVQSRWRQTQKQSKKNQQALKEVREAIRKNITYANRVQTEIENLFNMDKNKNDAQAKQVRQIFYNCKSNFSTTMQTLQKINDLKKQTQQYETKVHILSGKNLAANIQKLKLAFEELKKQVNELKSKNQK